MRVRERTVKVSGWVPRKETRDRSSEQGPSAHAQMRLLQWCWPILPDWWGPFTTVSDLQRIRTVEGQVLSQACKRPWQDPWRQNRLVDGEPPL